MRSGAPAEGARGEGRRPGPSVPLQPRRREREIERVGRHVECAAETGGPEEMPPPMRQGAKAALGCGECERDRPP
eukprot:4466165-Alexandrium_andersonii.AAC.1